MPIQAPQWTDYLNCPVCCREFGAAPRCPISLKCGHTLCRHCLNYLLRKQCPFDQTFIYVEPEEFVVNTALLQLAGYSPPVQPYHPPCIQSLPETDRKAYDVVVRSMEQLAVYLKYCATSNTSGSCLSRPMQRKLVTLLQCAITDVEGRCRAVRAVRSLGERTVTELILQHQNPHQLSANLWAAVRARGCQFLGPAMQEEILKLVLLALEDGSALSRKVLVMFVVQRLAPHFPQASKTSIGHVVQLLYRASCFKVSKRIECSSLMQLKEEFRTYESLRREHDTQIVQIATESGLRIAPDQWSALLYGDTVHKSHMQSIIDRLQTPQSFSQLVQELFIASQRIGESEHLIRMSVHLGCLANMDSNSDAKYPTWQQLAEVMTSIKEVVSGLIQYMRQAAGRDTNHNQKYTNQERCPEPSTSQSSPQPAGATPTHSRYKVSMCRDVLANSYCPRGTACTFAHSEVEIGRYRNMPGGNHNATNGNYTYASPLPPGAAVSIPAHMQMNMQTQTQQQQLPHSLPLVQQVSQPPPLVQQLSQPPPLVQQLSQPPSIVQQLSQATMKSQLSPAPSMVPQISCASPLGQQLQLPQTMGVAMPLYQRFPMAQPPPQNYTVPTMSSTPSGVPPPNMIHDNSYKVETSSYPSSIMHSQGAGLSQNGLVVPVTERSYYEPFSSGHDTMNNQYQVPEYSNSLYPPQNPNCLINYQQDVNYAPPMQQQLIAPHEPQRNISPYLYEDRSSEIMQNMPRCYAAVTRGRADSLWPTPPSDVFGFEDLRVALPCCQPENIYGVAYDHLAGNDRLISERATIPVDTRAEAEDELEEELQALERRIDTEYKSD